MNASSAASLLPSAGAPSSGAPWIACLGRVREAAPLVHCLTNTVVQQITANALLAAGASPAMVDHPEEAPLFAAAASGVLVNLGTVSPHQVEAMPRAARAAAESATPWVLDPVAVGGLPVRTRLAHTLTAIGPTAIRANASEVLALGGVDDGGRGPDSTATPDVALDAARALARDTGGVVAVSGERDLVVSAGRTTWITGGDPLLTRVTGTGCALGAITAAVLGACPAADPHDAVVAAHALVAAAGSRGAHGATGPGSFAVAWLDALGALAPDDVAAAVLVEES